MDLVSEINVYIYYIKIRLLESDQKCLRHGSTCSTKLF